MFVDAGTLLPQSRVVAVSGRRRACPDQVAHGSAPGTGCSIGRAGVAPSFSTMRLAFLRDRYFTSPEIEDGASVHLSLAAYNAGPARVRKMRARTRKMGLDPNIWFRNVERAAQQMVGSETTRYVANVYKYYLAYSLLNNLNDNKAKALKAQTQ